MICARIETSSAETGSSSMISRASVATARAMAMRWRWPPLNSCGIEPGLDGLRPTSSSDLGDAVAHLLGRVPPWASSGSAMMSPTRIRGLSELNGSWKTAWTAWR